MIDPSLPDDKSAPFRKPARPSTTRMDVVAISCPGRVCIRRRDLLSSRSILWDGEEAKAA